MIFNTRKQVKIIDASKENWSYKLIHSYIDVRELYYDRTKGDWFFVTVCKRVLRYKNVRIIDNCTRNKVEKYIKKI